MKRLKTFLLDERHHIWCMSYYRQCSWGIPISLVKGATLNDFVTDFQGCIAKSIVRSQPWQKNVQPHNRAKGLGSYEDKSSIDRCWKCQHFYTESAAVLMPFCLFVSCLHHYRSERYFLEMVLTDMDLVAKEDILAWDPCTRITLYRSVTVALLSFRGVSHALGRTGGALIFTWS